MAFSDPQKIIDQCGLLEGQTVADLGAGSGFYSLAAAKLVGESGKIYAVDIQQDLLARIKSMAQAAKLHNIEVVHGDIEHPGGTRIRDASVDLALATNVLFQIENKEGFVNEIKRIVKPGGRVLVVDWSDSFGGMGPQPEFVVEEDKAKALFEKKGFTLVNSIFAGDHHYGFIFRNQ